MAGIVRTGQLELRPNITLTGNPLYYIWEISDVEEMRLTSTGLGIGGTPGTPLDVIGTTGTVTARAIATTGTPQFSVVTDFGNYAMQGNGGADRFHIYDHGNTDQVYIYDGGASGYHRWYQNNVEEMRLNSLGLGIQGTPGYPLDIWEGNVAALIGADSGLETRTDSTDKFARIGTPHYTNAEEPSALLTSYNSTLGNFIYVGGGTSSFNTATEIRFYTASDITTTTGTERGKFNDEGLSILAGTLKIQEQAEAEADSSGYGQIWVDTATPNNLYFTNDAGDDIPIDEGVAKAYFLSTGTVTGTTGPSLNTSSLTDSGTGDYKGNYSNAMSSSSITVLTVGNNNTPTDKIANNGNVTSSQTDHNCYDVSGAAANDFNIHVSLFGDLA